MEKPFLTAGNICLKDFLGTLNKKFQNPGLHLSAEVIYHVDKGEKVIYFTWLQY